MDEEVGEDTDIDESEDEDNTEDATTKKRGTRRAYMPVEGSPVCEHLDSIKDKVQRGVCPLDLCNGQAWIPPKLNAISRSFGSEAEPNKFYLGNVWIFIWLPLVQFARLMPRKIQCIHCKCDSTTPKTYKYRPFHWWDSIVWVLHQRIHCIGCGRSFTTIDPEFLSSIPTAVAEEFPVVSFQYGPGMHASMLYLSLLLVPKQILFGTFTSTFNMLQKMKHAQTVPVVIGGEKGGRCAYWPLCQMDRTECGGKRKELCAVCGANGSKKTPSKEEHDYQYRLHTWSETAKKSSCYYRPFCNKKAIVCGGTGIGLCSTFFGEEGSTKMPPEADELKKAKRLARNQERSKRKKNKST